MNGNKRNSKKLNILLAIICILLIGVLGSIFMMSRESEKSGSTPSGKKLAGSEQKGIEDYEAVKEHASQLEKEDGAADDSSKSSDSVDAKSDGIQQTAAIRQMTKSKCKELILIQQNLRIVQTARMKQRLIPQTQKKEISGIVCWGMI